MIIAIDGPAGSGKSTVAKMLSKKLNLFYLDTGAIYRALTLQVLKKKIDPHNLEEILKVLENFNIEFKQDRRGNWKVIVGGKDVTSEIRSPEVGRYVSLISAYPEVRKRMLLLQRELAKNGAVAEGRDTTSVVFPRATLKIYLTADKEERIKRRLKEWKNKGIKCDYEDAKKDIEKRDELDSTRKIAPLKMAEGAVVIDTTNLHPDEVVKKIIKLIERKKTCSGK